MNNLWLRIFSGFFYVLILLLGTIPYKNYSILIFSDYYFIFSHKKIFYILILFLFTLTSLEVSSFFYKNCLIMLMGILITYIPFLIFSKYYFNSSFNYPLQLNQIIQFLILVFLFIISCITIFIFPNKLTVNIIKLFLLFCYIGIPFSLVLIISEIKWSIHDESSLRIFLIFLLIWTSDTFSYIIGNFFGKRKLFPQISPKKTYEGLIGGILFTILVGIIIETYVFNSKLNWIILGTLISIFAPIGDLVASKLKREFNIKQSSYLIPGHGGFLDRLDSFIMCIPFILLYQVIIYLTL